VALSAIFPFAFEVMIMIVGRQLGISGKRRNHERQFLNDSL
jgi:hypothetical protein